MSLQENGRPLAFHRGRWRRAMLAALLVMTVAFGLAPSATASEGSVVGSATLTCTEAGNVLVVGSASNGTDTDVEVTFDVLGSSHGVTVTAGSGAEYSQDSGQTSVGPGSVSFVVNGSSGTVYYGSMTCPPPDPTQPPPSYSFGPIELYVASPPDEQTEFGVWADCYHMVISGFVAGESASLQVTVQGREYPEQTVDGGELMMPFNFDWPVYGTSAPYTVVIGGVTRSGTIDEECESEPTEETTSEVSTATSTSTPPTETVASTTTSEQPTSESTSETASASPTPTIPTETTVAETTPNSSPPASTTPERTCSEKQHLLTKGPYKDQCVDNEPEGWPPSDGSSPPSSSSLATSASAGGSGNPAAVESGSSGNVSGANGPPASSGYGSGGSSGSQPAPTPAVENHSGGGYVIVGGGGGDF